MSQVGWVGVGCLPLVMLNQCLARLVPPMFVLTHVNSGGSGGWYCIPPDSAETFLGLFVTLTSVLIVGNFGGSTRLVWVPPDSIKFVFEFSRSLLFALVVSVVTGSGGLFRAPLESFRSLGRSVCPPLVHSFDESSGLSCAPPAFDEAVLDLSWGGGPPSISGGYSRRDRKSAITFLAPEICFMSNSYPDSSQ